MIYKLGERLKNLRLENGFTRTEVSRRLKISKDSIRKYENEINQPNIETLRQIASLYKVSTDYILGIEQDRKIVIIVTTQNQIQRYIKVMDIVFNQMED